jgi:voltage-gated potassium channel Kch
MDPVVFRLRTFLAATLLVTLGVAVALARVEQLSPMDAAYFTVVTITTVGYGDIHPLTATGKVLAMVLILGGVGMFTGLVANGTELLVSRRAKMLRQQKQNVVIGVFFAELGTDLLRRCVAQDPHLRNIRQRR